MFKYLKGNYSNGIDVGQNWRRQGSTHEWSFVSFEHCIYRKMHVCCQRHRSTALQIFIGDLVTSLLSTQPIALFEWKKVCHLRSFSWQLESERKKEPQILSPMLLSKLSDPIFHCFLVNILPAALLPVSFIFLTPLHRKTFRIQLDWNYDLPDKTII